jgi:hypothetical protein
MVFGGIAGIMPSEHGNPDDLDRIPSVNTSREAGDLQDMYRRTLAASWTCRDGELPPDQLIEDLFAEGAAWAGNNPSSLFERSGRDGYEESISVSDADSRTVIQGNRLSPNPEKRSKSTSSNHSRGGSKSEDIISRRRSLGRPLYDKEGRWRNRTSTREVSEFDVRGDLRTWQISVKD